MALSCPGTIFPTSRFCRSFLCKNYKTGSSSIGQNTSVDSKMMVLINIRTIGYNIKTKMWVSRALPSWPCPFLFFEFSRSQLYFSGFAFPLIFRGLHSCPEHRQTSRFSQPGAFGECGRRLGREFPNNLHQAPGLIVKVSIQTNFFLLLNTCTMRGAVSISITTFGKALQQVRIY